MESITSVSLTGSDYIVNMKHVTWNEAKTSCENKSSTLAQILDVVTFDKVRSVFPNNGLNQYEPLWIGLSFSPAWFWSETKQISTFVNWKTGQPNNGNNCAAVLVENGTWTTEPCSEQHPFFCYGGMNDISLVLIFKSVTTDGMTRKYLMQDITKIIHFFVLFNS